MTDRLVLQYVGRGKSLPDIPARDLFSRETKRFGKAFLLASGLYVEVPKRRRKKTVKEAVDIDVKETEDSKEGDTEGEANSDAEDA